MPLLAIVMLDHVIISASKRVESLRRRFD